MTSEEIRAAAIKGIIDRNKSYLKGYGIESPKELSEEEKERLLLIKNYLQNPKLFEIITIEEFDKKITGEYKSRKAIFLSLCSIWLKDNEIPINTLISSESSAGKSYVCKQIIKIFPKDKVEYRSKISGEAFTYWHTNEDNWDWNGKICYLEDISQNVLDSSTFKVMASEGSIATVVKNQKAVDLIVNGKPCLLVTTAKTNPSTEILNRFQIISLDETTKQTYEITKSEALQEKKEPYDSDIVKALSLLERKNVYIDFGIAIHEYLNKNYSFDDLRMRRDFSRLLDLIKCSCVLHQYQRETNSNGDLLATEQDYEIAREVINYITTTTLKGLTHNLAKAFECCIQESEFTAKDIHANHPIVSLQQWYEYLDNLCERGLLVTSLKDVGGFEKDGRTIGAKRVTYFKTLSKKSFNLPEFKDLPSSRNSLIGKNGLIGLKGLKGLNGIIPIQPIQPIKAILGDSNSNICSSCGSLDGFIVCNNQKLCPECYRKVQK